ncbi:MAG: MGMT family protein [Myxococcota bacterium]
MPRRRRDRLAREGRALTSHSPSSYERIYRVVKRVPKGRVATYGQIAELAELPRQARQVGYALHALSGDASGTVPWQRGVNARGEVSERAVRGHEPVQRAMLEAEGVVFGGNGRIDLARYRWAPRRR